MSKQVKTLSDEALSLICSLLRNAQTTGDVISDTISSNATYSSLKIEEILEEYAKHEDIETIDLATLESMLGLSTEELEGLSQIIDDTQIVLNKTYSSSKIYSSIAQCLEDSKAYTISEFSKSIGASYKVVASVDQMTDSKILYLLKDADSGMYNIYVYNTDTSTAELIGSFEINLDDYYTKTESEDLFVTKTDLVANYTTKQEVADGYATKEELSDLQEAIDNVTVEVSQESDNQLEQKDDGLYVGKIDIITTLTQDTVSDTSVPSSKAVYDELQKVSTGNSAYEIAKKNGFEGTEEEWLESLKGEDGNDGRSIKAITKDDNNNIIVTFSDNTTENIGELSVDIQGDFLTENGFGNLRFVDNKFQYYDKETSQWVDTFVSSDNAYIITLTPQPMDKFIATCNPDTMNIELKIDESSDIIVDGQTLCIVEKVIIRRKKDDFPTDENDGDLVLEIERKDFGNYKNRPYTDVIDGVAVGDVYYYKAFPVSNTGIVANIADNEVSCTIKDYWLYGFKLDQNESDPASMITYIEDNENYSSAYMNYTNDSFDYGDWDNVWFIKDLKPCMLNYDGTVTYELDKNDYSLKADGTASDITNNSFEGNAMVGVPKVYWKIVDNGDNTANIYFSNKKVDEDFVCWSHIDNNGNEIDYCYMPIYNGSNVSSQLRSLSGKTPIYSKTATTEITYALANNLTSDIIWYTEVFSDRMLINLLLLLIGKSTNTQTVFGNGHYTGSSSASHLLVAGTLNDKGLFYGTNGTGKGVKVFGMENWWGNQWRRIAGWINDKGNQKIKMTYGQSDGSTVDGYNTDGSGYIAIGCTPSGTSGGYVRKMTVTENGLIPTTASGSATTYYTDGLWFSNSQVDYALVGGSSGDGLYVGALCSSLSDAASVVHWSAGAAVSCKPLKTT